MVKSDRNGSTRSRRRVAKGRASVSRPASHGSSNGELEAATRLKLHDKQSERDYRELRIDKVGVRNLRFPIS